MEPDSGGSEGGTLLTFKGNGFAADGFAVYIDGQPCSIRDGLSNNQVTIVQVALPPSNAVHPMCSCVVVSSGTFNLILSVHVHCSETIWKWGCPGHIYSQHFQAIDFPL